MFSLESPDRGDSNEYTQHTFYYIKRNLPLIILNLQLSVFFFSRGLKNEFEIAVVNEPSVFEPPKFYCVLCCCPCLFVSLLVMLPKKNRGGIYM